MSADQEGLFGRNFALLKILGSDRLDAVAKKWLENNDPNQLFQYFSENLTVDIKEEIKNVGIFSYFPNIPLYTEYRRNVEDAAYQGENVVSTGKNKEGQLEYLCLGLNGKFVIKTEEEIDKVFVDDLLKSEKWKKEYEAYAKEDKDTTPLEYFYNTKESVKKYNKKCWENSETFKLNKGTGNLCEKYMEIYCTKGFKAYQAYYWKTHEFGSQFDITKINKLLSLSIEEIEKSESFDTIFE